MFNTLASYLLGQTSSNNNAINNTATDQQSNDNLEQASATAAADNLKIKTTICDENEWLIVDHEDDESEEDRRTDSEEELPTVEIKNCPLIYKSKRNGPPTSVSPNLMEESTADDQWFVTPPPCFTSTTGLQLESSPFENLLIEHPR
jgi:DOR family